jgi:hypothetical protein
MASPTGTKELASSALWAERQKLAAALGAGLGRVVAGRERTGRAGRSLLCAALVGLDLGAADAELGCDDRSAPQFLPG